MILNLDSKDNSQNYVTTLCFLIGDALSFLIFSASSPESDLWNCFSAMLVCFFNSLTHGEHSNRLTVAAFSTNPFSAKTFWPVKNSYIPIFPDHKDETIPVSLSKSHRALSYSILLLFWFCLVDYVNRLPDGQVVLFTKNENGSLV